MSPVLRRGARRLPSCRRGAVTVDFVLWMPVFAFALAVVADASLLLSAQSRLLDVARDASRVVSLGLSDTAQAEAMIAGRMGWTTGWTAEVVEVGNFVTTRVSVPYASVTAFGGAVFGSATLAMEYSMFREATLDGVGLGG